MKAAICLSGMPRNIENSYKWLDESVLSVLRENNVNYDFFVSFWDSKNTSLKYNRISSLFNPKRFAIEAWNEEKIIELGFKQLKKYDNGPNALGMFYQIYKCNELRKEYEKEQNIKYDVAFRLRTELQFKSKLDVNELRCIVDSEDKTLFLRLIPNDRIFWTRDTLAFSNGNTMDIYSDLFNHIFDLNISARSSTAEVLLRAWINQNGMDCRNTTLDNKVVRE